MKKISSKDRNFTVVNMMQSFPFGQLTQKVDEDELVLVLKKLNFSSQKQLETIRKMIQIVENISHQSLISFHHAQKGPEQCYLFYQYAPLAIQKWVLELGDDILQNLQFSMLNLASYLTQRGIKFNFDPKCIGLSKEIKVKYFLSNFTIDHEKKMINYKQIQREINKFFISFKNAAQVRREEEEEQYRKSLGTFASIITRESWDTKSVCMPQTARIMGKQQVFLEKISTFKKKSLLIFQRLKTLKILKE